MDYGQLGSYFLRVASKRLTDTDVNPEVSHGHEINGVQSLVSVLGEDDLRQVECHYVYLSDDYGPISSVSGISWYDSRRNNPTRHSEWRLYYSAEAEAMQLARPEDLLVITVARGGAISLVVAQGGSTVEAQVMWLFGLDDDYRFLEAKSLGRPVDALSLSLLEDMGISVDAETPAESHIDEMLELWPDEFPSGKRFADYARQVSGVRAQDAGPDKALYAWYTTQTELFMAYEQVDRERRLGPLTRNVADPDYEAIIETVQSMRQRRFSSAGHALEYHLEHIFTLREIRFKPQARVEDGKRPDFLFPGEDEYNDPEFPADRLTLLGAKTTAKDRWRQVLSEGNRIPNKHLVTLERAISERQTHEMADANLTLVVPTPIWDTYTLSQREWLWSLEDFCEMVEEKQRRSA